MKMTYLNSVDYGLMCKIGANAPRQILLGDEFTSSSYSLDQILAFRAMFAEIKKAQHLETNIPCHFEGKTFVPKRLSQQKFEEIENELDLHAIFIQTLESLLDSIDEGKIKPYTRSIFHFLNRRCGR